LGSLARAGAHLAAHPTRCDPLDLAPPIASRPNREAPIPDARRNASISFSSAAGRRRTGAGRGARDTAGGAIAAITGAGSGPGWR
jgi:hypothetical protein